MNIFPDTAVKICAMPSQEKRGARLLFIIACEFCGQNGEAGLDKSGVGYFQFAGWGNIGGRYWCGICDPRLLAQEE